MANTSNFNAIHYTNLTNLQPTTAGIMIYSRDGMSGLREQLATAIRSRANQQYIAIGNSIVPAAAISILIAIFF
jgi:hypothetical protein